MFETSHPFAFFDYFRVPYDVRPPQDAGGHLGAPASVGWLRPVPQSGRPARSLLWLRADATEPVRPLAYRLGRYKLHNFTFFGHVALDAAVPAMLQELGHGWRPADPLLGADGRPVAAIWRDSDGNVFLPFDPGEVMQLFWSEEYRNVGRSALIAVGHAVSLRGYYLVRPVLPRLLQLQLRRVFTLAQGRSSFPGWPIEESLHDFYTWLFALAVQLAGAPVPFLDLWPGGRSWALVLTHDVETDAGQRDMHLLRGLERERGYQSSWNFVAMRYRVDDDVVRSLQAEGCEVGVHGLRHDGRDLGSRRLMEKRLPTMRSYAERWNAVGFRSPGTQREWKWMPLLGFEYDSSYSDTDPYEPQPGGCCTYLPYFNDGMVELPITLPQDHTLFTILQHSDADVWLRKAHLLRERNAMALVLTHPDYAHDPRISEGYRRLLDAFREDDTLWRALPRDVAAWWRRRAASRIRASGGGWRIEGPASTEGKVRFATADGAAAGPGGKLLQAAPGAAGGPGGQVADRTAGHVLMIVENVPLGIDQRLRKQVRELLGSGYRVSVVTRRDPENAGYRDLPGLTVLDYPAPAEPRRMSGYVSEYGVSFGWAAVLATAARLQGSIDVVQLCQPPDIYFPIAWLLRWLGAKVVVDQRDLMPELFAARYEQPKPAVMSTLRWLERRAQGVAVHTICTNGYFRDRLIGAGATPERVTIVGNGPVLDRINRAVADPALKGDHKFLCCWIGKMGRQDRLDLLLRGIACIVHDLGRTDCGFAILGDGESLDETRSESARLGLDPWVSFPGWLPEQQVFTYLATADLGLDTSLQEDISPVKVMEYMACGLPFVAFDVQETRAMGQDASVLVAPADIESYARAIAALLGDQARRTEMGEVGRKRVREDLAWERQSAAYLDVMRSVCRQRRQP
jgi:glycosyltransferase involved in cell wall biosynthesis